MSTATTTAQPQRIYLRDYQPPAFLIDATALQFVLGEEVTTVTATLSFRKNPKSKSSDKNWVLQGEKMTLKEVRLNDTLLPASAYSVGDNSLTILNAPDSGILTTVVDLQPHLNTQLSGLYQSNGIFCTQCESHGFRRITYFVDRPDMLSRFTTTIIADKARYPVLLSNGNLVEQKDLAEGKHLAKWEDPFLKPGYLFALVAGNLDVIRDEFITQSGRKVRLAIYVEKGKSSQAEFAMGAVKRAMRWDEETFGREYDLDDYMIVAVSDFNFGAMENKGLNIFNDRYILARSDTATDADFIAIEEVIGHEYFHNWSGNRVTVRDWFQITLKEGLTVFRDQSFSGDMHSKVVKRIQDARVIRNSQFPQDAGPMAHPIRPDSYIEVNNFYTVTVYQKGAEVIRMIQTLLGVKKFREGMDLYFKRHDGDSITTEEFVRAMEDASGEDLTQFRRWYSQAGTPILRVSDHFDAAKSTYTLTIEQSCPPTAEQAKKEPFHIPLAMGLLETSGKSLPLQLHNESAPYADPTRVLSIKKPKETFTFVNIKNKPIPSLLRHFSAPVKLEYSYTEADQIFLLAHDEDAFSRWDAGQQLLIRLLTRLADDYRFERTMRIDNELVEAFRQVLKNKTLDPALKAETLSLPSVAYLLETLEGVPLEAIWGAREFLWKTLAEALKVELQEIYAADQAVGATFELTPEAIGKRTLKNVCLVWLNRLDTPEVRKLARAQFKQSHNMTDQIGALSALNETDSEERRESLQDFYTQWQHESLVLDKWFALQAHSSIPGTLENVQALLKHPAYDPRNPNRVRALVGTFAAANYLQFHALEGSGYRFLAEQVKVIDTFNPQLAARLIEPLTRWKKFDPLRQSLMRAELAQLAEHPLSRDLFEIVDRSLRFN